jgi:hypothetical protein
MDLGKYQASVKTTTKQARCHSNKKVEQMNLQSFLKNE